MQLVLQALCAFLHQVRSLSNCRLVLFANHLNCSTLLDTSLPPSPLVSSSHFTPFLLITRVFGGMASGLGGVEVWWVVEERFLYPYFRPCFGNNFIFCNTMDLCFKSWKSRGVCVFFLHPSPKWVCSPATIKFSKYSCRLINERNSYSNFGFVSSGVGLFWFYFYVFLVFRHLVSSLTSCRLLLFVKYTMNSSSYLPPLHCLSSPLLTHP